MGAYVYKGKTYEVDDLDFLRDPGAWDEDFAEGMAQHLGMPKGLLKEQRDVIQYIRECYKTTRRCPNVYETCRMCGLHLNELKRLFPTGYLRGACKLAGITYQIGYLGQDYVPSATGEDLQAITIGKTYEVDVRGFLVNPDDWDEYYAAHRAFDMKIPGGKLTPEHWKIIRFLRKSYETNHYVPTVYETCEKNGLEIDGLERLFPDGYHRGAVKIAGLKIR